MNQLTFIEKIQVLFEMLFSSPVIIGIFVFSLALMILLFYYSKLNKKIIKLIFIVLYVSLILFAVIKYGSYFLSSLDSFVTLFMANIYFPTIPVYVFIMLLSFIIMIVTLSNKRINKIVKIINTVFFSIIQMLFVLFIYIVETNNIDVSTNQNLYTNEQTLTLLELGMGLFIIWIIVLLIFYYLKKADKIFKVNKSSDNDDFDEYINDYNEPNNINNSVQVANFNNNLVENLVPEVGLFDSNNEEIISFDNDEVISFDNDNFDNINKNTNNGLKSSQIEAVDVFDSFDFLDVSNNSLTRKNNDVEVVDFDL